MLGTCKVGYGLYLVGAKFGSDVRGWRERGVMWREGVPSRVVGGVEGLRRKRPFAHL